MEDVFVFVLVAYFAMLLGWEEKENGLCSVTRATKHGRGRHVIAKLFALTIHTALTTSILFVIRFLWYGIKVGFTDLRLPMQSVMAYSESSLRISLADMTAFVLLSKIAAALIVGLLAANVIVFLYFYQGNIAVRKGKTLSNRILGTSLFGQETYKIFVMNKALVVFALFVLILRYVQVNEKYYISEGEKILLQSYANS